MDNNPLNEMLVRGMPYYHEHVDIAMLAEWMEAEPTLVRDSLAWQLLNRQLQVLANDRTAGFQGLYRDGKRLKAKVCMIDNGQGGEVKVWEYHHVLKTKTNVVHFPTGRLAAQAQYNVVEIMEFAPARAAIVDGFVAVVRIGDEWGADAKAVAAFAPPDPYPRAIRSYGPR